MPRSLSEKPSAEADGAFTSALVKLRAEIIRTALCADELAEAETTRRGRGMALSLAQRMRNAAMAGDMVEACKRG